MSIQLPDKVYIILGNIALAVFPPSGGARMKYRVSIQKTEEGYAIWVPGLPGCWSQGGSESEALENIKDAIEVYLDTVNTLTADKDTRYVEIANA